LRWESGKTMHKGNISAWIDPHVHILPERRMRGLVRWVKKFTPGFPVSEDIEAGEILAALREAEIPCFFNLVFPLWEEETEDLNRYNRDFCAGVPEAIPFGSVHIDTPDKQKETRRCIEEYGFLGMKLHPYAQRFPAFGPEMRPMFEVLNEHRKPLLVHTGFDVFYGMDMDFGDMEAVIRDYPDMQLVAVHSLFPRFALAYRLLREYPNFWLDMTNTISCMRIYEDIEQNKSDTPDIASSLEAEDVRENHEYFYSLFSDFPERIMYGTDFPVGFGYHPALLDDLLSFGFEDQVEEYALNGAVRGLMRRCGWPDPLASPPGAP
jgi:predicted TIM-barrel fold metal-dependent hydrolase